MLQHFELILFKKKTNKWKVIRFTFIFNISWICDFVQSRSLDLWVTPKPQSSGRHKFYIYCPGNHVIQFSINKCVAVVNIKLLW